MECNVVVTVNEWDSDGEDLSHLETVYKLTLQREPFDSYATICNHAIDLVSEMTGWLISDCSITIDDASE